MDFGLLQPEQLMSLADSEGMLNEVKPVSNQTVYVSVTADVPEQMISVATQTDIHSHTERKRSNFGTTDEVAEIKKRRLNIEGVFTVAVQIVSLLIYAYHCLIASVFRVGKS